MSEAKFGRSCLDVQIARYAQAASGLEFGCRFAHPGYPCFAPEADKEQIVWVSPFCADCVAKVFLHR